MIPHNSSSTAEQPSNLGQIIFWAAIAVLTLLGAILRMQGLGDRPLWGDEIYTVAHAVGSWVPDWVQHANHLQPAAVYQEKLQLVPRALSLMDNLNRTVKVLIHNNHPPLFFSFMGVWLQTVGISILSLRWPAYAFGVISIPLFACWARSLAGTRIALFATALWTVSGYQIFQAQNARPYTLLTCLVLLVAWAWIRLAYGKARHRWLWWPVMILASIIALHTHYFALPVIGALWLLGWVTWSGRSRSGLWISLACVVAGALPLVWLLYQQWQSPYGMGATGHFTQATSWPLWQLPELVFRMMTDHIIPKNALSKWIILALTATAAISGFRHWWHYQKIGYQESPQYWLSAKWVWPLAWFAAVFGFQAILDLATHGNSLTVRRYTLLAAPATTMLIVLTLSWVSRNLGEKLYAYRGLIFAGLMGILILIAGINGWNVAQQNTFSNPDIRAAVRTIGQEATNIPVYVWPGNVRLLSTAWYLPAETPMTELQPKKGLPTDVPLEGMDTRNAWVLWIKPSGTALNQAKKTLRQQGWQGTIENADELNKKGVQLWRLKHKATSPTP